MGMDWKLEILDSLLTKDISYSLEQKRRKIPKKLYRYRSALIEENKNWRVSEILDGNIYLAHPRELNDPLESRFLLSEDEKSIERLIEKIKTNEEYNGKLANIDFSVFSEIEKKIMVDVIKFFLEQQNFAYSKKCRDIIKFACFTTKPLNLPMWNHYADGHKGYCLEYDTEKMSILLQNKLFPVCYVEKLPNLIDVLLSGNAQKFLFFDLIALQKLKDWSYEDEWRLISNIGDFYFSEKDVPDEFYDRGKLISFIKPSKIIMGMDIENSCKHEIERMGEIANIPVVQAKRTEYGVVISEEI